MNKEIVSEVRLELKKHADAKASESFKRFFKEEVKSYGVKSALIGKISAKTFKKIEGYSKEDIFFLCEELLKSDYSEEVFVGLNWASFIKERCVKSDFNLFEKWLKKYVNDWAKCDVFCGSSIGYLVEKYPELINRLKKWTRSKNRWLKRASAVSLIGLARRGKRLNDAFRIADLLLQEKDDMVQKGYGWLLKEESRINQSQVFKYVVKNKKIMPRTALRYAIELMPENLRRKAMER